MAQHLRIGSVINYGTIYVNATVSNITDAYIELEVPLSGGGTETRVLPWPSISATAIVVVTD
jgi:hypothetical protein